MILYTKITRNDDPEKGLAYHCASCGTIIAYADAAIGINGSTNHSFLNPAGVRCNFMTVADCENVLVYDQLFLEHSWFPGYGWRFLLCSVCHQHLGWKYDVVGSALSPPEFFGLLFDAVKPKARDNP
jgi:cereblon